MMPGKFLRWVAGLHFHKWVKSRPQTILDIHPPLGTPKLTRRCMVCGRVDEWLPGYGGSELGCWMRVP